MGRKPSEKPKMKYKKGLWSPDEDQKLRDYILNHGHGCWTAIPINAGLQRNGKSCRLRWINYLRPGLKRGMFTINEEETILNLHSMLGNKWSLISQHLPGRTDNEIKNHWHSYLKKKASKLQYTQAPLKSVQKISETKSKESSQSSLNLTRRNPTLDSFERMEGLSNDSDQFSPQVFDCLKVAKLPKILFADWFSLDQFQDFGHSDEQASSKNSSHGYSSNYKEAQIMNPYDQHVGSGFYDLEAEHNFDTMNAESRDTCDSETADNVYSNFFFHDLMYTSDVLLCTNPCSI